ncbi:MAG: protein translocase subunit SecF [Patescibacteria group bacterium]
MFVVTYRKFFYGLSALLMIGSIVALSVWGLKFGIDFKGGAILEVAYTDVRPETAQVKEALAPLSLGEYSVRTTGEKGFIIRTKTITPAEKTAIVEALSKGGVAVTESRFDSIGPLLGAEAAKKAMTSIALVILCIVLYITFAFRAVSEPVSSWKYGLVAIFSLIHDVLVPAGVFAVLGHFQGIEVDTLFVTALLVILGFSIHDTIVVFDRVRENLRLNRREDFATTVGTSINQTFARSINTSLTVLIALLVLYFVGGESTRHFTLALLVGIVAGTYSSIFLGSPLLVTLEQWQNKTK